jgi:leucyl aminopeptidase
MVDLATLTGAIIIALGNDYAGCYANDEELGANLMAASAKEGEPLWRMPLPAQYDKNIDSMIADVKNTGGRPGGSITAAMFIQRFTNGVPWAHLDIASTAWKKPSSVPTIPDGATGFGVRLLNSMIQEKYEG